MELFLQADTSSLGYQIGYRIGSWLPFVLLAILLFFMIRSIRRQQKKGN
ncbi:MAG: hypothetical protein KDC43_16460 [Saprospiraceae bacterium]|nr:hypothetical protein [Saprospiraceae bacterium]MCB0625457.1 hypothetical protein [Saprospiraceae bacterium]MCB0676023.1 hypothetical protein [Saprospiraceae bacterium]MCB0681329.1 hypothetical protein [Saprospiraceae bacterium]